MGYSFTEKKRIRKSFSKRSEVDQIPNLLEIQKESYRKLLQKGVSPEQRIDQGFQMINIAGDLFLMQEAATDLLKALGRGPK